MHSCSVCHRFGLYTWCRYTWCRHQHGSCSNAAQGCPPQLGRVNITFVQVFYRFCVSYTLQRASRWVAGSRGSPVLIFRYRLSTLANTRARIRRCEHELFVWCMRDTRPSFIDTQTPKCKKHEPVTRVRPSDKQPPPPPILFLCSGSVCLSARPSVHLSLSLSCRYLSLAVSLALLCPYSRERSRSWDR